MKQPWERAFALQELGFIRVNSGSLVGKNDFKRYSPPVRELSLKIKRMMLDIPLTSLYYQIIQ